MKNILLMTVAAFAAAELFAAVPEVEVTEVGQNEQRVVTVGYTLSAPAVVTVDFLTNGVSLMTFESRPSGDVGWVATAGSKTIAWRPRKSLPSGLELKDVTVRVEAYSPARQPDYMVVDPATGWQRFYATSNDVPGGVLANEDYRGKYLLLRRIPAAWKEVVLGKPHPGWSGASSRRVRHAVMLTNDFYMTVFPVTRGQLAQAYGWTKATDDTYTGQGDKTTHWRLRPAEGMGYDDIRGGEADDKIDWPTTGDRVATGSILGKFRANTGLLFDLPTDAQYEIACRGGIENADFYCGGFDWRDATAETLAKRIGWYEDNWADDPLKPAGATSANFTHVVGQKEPNPTGSTTSAATCAVSAATGGWTSRARPRTATCRSTTSRRVRRRNRPSWSAASTGASATAATTMRPLTSCRPSPATRRRPARRARAAALITSASAWSVPRSSAGGSSNSKQQL